MRNLWMILVGAAAVTAVGCSAAPAAEPGDDDETATSESAATLSSTSTYYSARRDFRRCISPLCGGYWVKRVNRALTKCADGSWQSECYVAEIDGSAAGLDPSDFPAGATPLYRATIGSLTYNDQWTLGVLKPTEVWASATDATPTGDFFRVRYDGIVCVRAPCFDSTADKLNSTVTRRLSGFDGALGGKVSTVLREQKVIAAGNVHGTRGGGLSLGVSQYFTRVTPSDPLYCDNDAQCTITPYSKPVASATDCYCAHCPVFPMSTAAASRNEASWHRTCDGKPLMCPMIMCIKPPVVACQNHRCAVPTP